MRIALYRLIVLLDSVLAVGLVMPAAAQQQAEPYLVKDINSQPDQSASSEPRNFVSVGSTTLFTVSTAGASDASLWKTDGTTEGTVLVKDFGTHYNLHKLVNVNGTLFFIATSYTGSHEAHTQLWRSDGTASGTVLLKDFLPYSTVAMLTARGSDLVFVVSGSVSGLVLWRSDGTESGTEPLTQIPPLASNLIDVDGTVFFLTDDLPDGGLWKTDGTADGTVPVSPALDTLRPCGHSSAPTSLLVDVDGVLFFGTTTDPTTRCGLWKADGSAEGTVLVKDVVIGSARATLDQFAPVHGMLFFSVAGGSQDSLWVSDGTTDGTRRLRDEYPRYLTAAGDQVFFNGREAIDDVELWKSDGTEGGTVRVKDINRGADPSFPSNLTAVGDILFFNVCFGTCSGDLCLCQRRELWRSDGSEAGTMRLADVSALNPANGNGLLLFSASDGQHGEELWKSDGSPAGTMQLKDINAATGYSNPSSFTDVGGSLFFVADDGMTGYELWKSDGTLAGTARVKDINPGDADSIQDLRTAVDHTLYFFADDGTHGLELWKSDGTDSGTILVKDINPVSVPPVLAPRPSLISVSSEVFFSANDGVHGIELWKTDGTEANTVLVKDINPGAAGSRPSSFVDVNGTLFFFANEEDRSGELWKSDGSDAGTVLVYRPIPATSYSHPINVNGALFFFSGVDLWRSNGTPGGTTIVSSLPRTQYGVPYYLTAAGNRLFFDAYTTDAGWELWMSDGTSTGTMMVKDLNPGPNGTSPALLVDVAGRLFFVASNGAYQNELWTSDGTAEGTIRLMKPAPEQLGAHILTLIPAAERLYFLVVAEGHTEVWRSNGTAAGTVLIESFPTSVSTPPFNANFLLGSTLFFTGSDPRFGTELWAVDVPDSRLPCGGDCDADGFVTIDELVTGVNIALGSTELDRCSVFDRDARGEVTIDELIIAVGNALNGCPA